VINNKETALKKSAHPRVVPVILCCAVATFPVLSISPAQALEPHNFQAGPLYIAPTLENRLGYTDNLLRSEEQEIGTWMNELSPQVQAWLREGVNTFSASYKLADYRYSDSHDDDYTDHTANLDLHREFNARHSLDLFGEYYDGHEERGTGFTDGIGFAVEKPVEYERTTFGGDYNYGSRHSRGAVEVGARSASYEYQNYRDFTRWRDRDQDTLSGTFFWQVGNRTDALVQVRYIGNDYDSTSPAELGGSLDSDEYNYMVGVSWDATAKTTGSVKFGLYERDYDYSGRGDTDGFHWEVEAAWWPRSYSRLSVATRRRTEETNGLGDAVDTEVLELGWNHEWSGRTTTRLGLSVANEAYAGTEREDDRLDLEASCQFALQRWLEVGVGLRHEARDSNFSVYEYTRNVYFVQASLSL
jgi:hypothetical protein